VTDAPPPIPNPPVHHGALRAPEIDYSALELRVLAHMAGGELPAWQQDIIDKLEGEKQIICGIDPASLAGDHTVMTTVLAGHTFSYLIIDDILNRSPLTEQLIEGDHELEGRFNGLLDEKLFAAFGGELPAKKVETGEFKPDNRKQRRIDAAKERRKPRGQRKRVIMDIETYDPRYGRNQKRKLGAEIARLEQALHLAITGGFSPAKGRHQSLDEFVEVYLEVDVREIEDAFTIRREASIRFVPVGRSEYKTMIYTSAYSGLIEWRGIVWQISDAAPRRDQRGLLRRRGRRVRPAGDRRPRQHPQAALLPHGLRAGCPAGPSGLRRWLAADLSVLPVRVGSNARGACPAQRRPAAPHPRGRTRATADEHLGSRH
jgi:hypothetical protein